DLKTIGPVAGRIISLEFDRDGRQLAAVIAGQGVLLWSLQAAGRSFLLQGDFTQTVFAPNGEVLCIGNGSEDLIVWSPTDGLTNTRKSSPSLAWGGSTLICLSPDGTLLASTNDREGGLWQRESRERIARLVGHTDQISTLAFSPDGKTLASGGSMGPVK